MPYLSAALALRHIKKSSRAGKMEGSDLTRAEEEPTFSFGDWIKVQFLEGKPMPSGKTHTGWVRVDDYCGDNKDDAYCVEENKFLDLYVGCESTKGGTGINDMNSSKYYRGTPPAGADKIVYGVMKKNGDKC